MDNLPEAVDAVAPATRVGDKPWGEFAGRAASRFFIGFVALLLVLPLVQTVVPVFRKLVAPVEERRQVSAPPAPNLLLRANGDFASALNAWFDDRVGFRDLFIRAKNQIDYSLFHTSRKVYVGKDGWLFDRANMNPVDRLDPAQMAALEARFTNLAKQLNDRGIRLIVIGYPDKSRIYPEMAPPDMPLAPPDDNYDKFRQFLSGRSDLTFIDAENIVLQEKTRVTEHLYSKTDLHINIIGQASVVPEIVKVIADIERRPDIRWREDLRLAHQAYFSGGSETRFLSLLFPVREVNSPYFDGLYTIGRKEADGTWTIPDHVALERADPGIGRPFDWEFRSNPDLCPQRLGGMVLFGNSFSDAYWALGLHRYFCFIRRARDPMSRFKLFYDTIPEGTKYLIFEYYAPWLPGGSPPADDGLPTE